MDLDIDNFEDFICFGLYGNKELWDDIPYELP